MQQKQIQVGNKKLLALDMPEVYIIKKDGKYYVSHSYSTGYGHGHTWNKDICRARRMTKEMAESILCHAKGKAILVQPTFSDASELMMKNLTDIEYEIIGFKNDITEEQWKEIVAHTLGLPERTYMDYNNEAKPGEFQHHVLKTASESGLSLLQANNIDYLNCLIIQIF